MSDNRQSDSIVGQRFCKLFASRRFWGNIKSKYIVNDGVFYKVMFDDGDVDILSEKEVLNDLEATKKVQEKDGSERKQKIEGDDDCSLLDPSATMSNWAEIGDKNGVRHVRIWGQRLYTVIGLSKGLVTIQSFHRTKDNEMGEVEATGQAFVGDVLISINGKKVMGLSVSEVSSLVRSLDRPLKLSFISGSNRNMANAIQKTLHTPKKNRVFEPGSFLINNLSQSDELQQKGIESLSKERTLLEGEQVASVASEIPKEIMSVNKSLTKKNARMELKSIALNGLATEKSTSRSSMDEELSARNVNVTKRQAVVGFNANIARKSSYTGKYEQIDNATEITGSLANDLLVHERTKEIVSQRGPAKSAATKLRTDKIIPASPSVSGKYIANDVRSTQPTSNDVRSMQPTQPLLSDVRFTQPKIEVLQESQSTTPGSAIQAAGAVATSGHDTMPRQKIPSSWIFYNYTIVQVQKEHLYVKLGVVDSQIIVTSFTRGRGNESGDIERSGKVFLGDILVAVNGRFLGSLASPHQVARLVTGLDRPFNVYFRRATWEELRHKA